MSSADVQQLMLKQVEELRADIKELRESMRELSERVVHLEHQEKVTRIYFAIGGGLAALVLRELIPRVLGIGG